MIADLLLAVASWLFRSACALIPHSERDWARAMQGELATLARPHERLLWAGGCFGAALRIRVASPEGRFEAICLSLLVPLTLLDWHSPDPTVTLVALAAIPALLGYWWPGQCLKIGLLFGAWLLAAHWLADLTVAWRPSYQQLPLSAGELVEIALVGAITIPAAIIGASLRRQRI